MAGGDEQLGPGVLYLLCLHAAVEDSLLHIGSRPRAAAGAAAEVVRPVGIHVYEIFAALLRNPPGFLVITLAESAFTFPAVITRVVEGSKVLMDRFINLDSPLLDILFEQIVDADELDVFIRIPFFETKPGRIVGVPSLWQDEILAPQFFVILYNPPDDCFHRFVVAREKAPVYAFPVLGSSRPGLVGGV